VEYGVKEQVKKPVTQIISQPTNSVDQFLARNRNTDLFESDNDYLFSTNHVYRSWDICLHGIEVILTSETDDGTIKTSANMYFNLDQEEFVNQVFDKFIKWDSVAAKNNAEPFEKDIGRCRDFRMGQMLSEERWHDYSFHWDLFGKSYLEDVCPPNGSSFYKEDVIHFQELLKRLPTIKAKLAEKIRNKEAQKDLFK
jgi:hypothetical protein